MIGLQLKLCCALPMKSSFLFTNFRKSYGRQPFHYQCWIYCLVWALTLGTRRNQCSFPVSVRRLSVPVKSSVTNWTKSCSQIRVFGAQMGAARPDCLHLYKTRNLLLHLERKTLQNRVAIVCVSLCFGLILFPVPFVLYHQSSGIRLHYVGL